MERRTGLSSSNSGKAAVQRRIEEAAAGQQPGEERSGKKTGGGSRAIPGETLRRSEAPDAIVDHYPARCGACGAPLTEATAINFISRQVTGVLHALCNAHHLRELKALVEIEKEDWARRMQRLLRRACHVVNLAREQDVPLKPGLIALIERGYDAIVADGRHSMKRSLR